MYDVTKKTVLDMQQDLESKKVTSVEIVLAYLSRIATIDNGEVPYNSILEVNPDALFIAETLDQERKMGIVRSKLHGIPVVLKDNINTNDKMHTTAGSLALQDHFAQKDAFLVQKLREDGAIILGKANLTEFANFMTYNMRNGYSSLGKEVLCPYNLEEDPSGSSAGSAVSVAIQVTPLAIGSETGGSIMSPSMKNGIVGLKPTMGLVSRTGIVPISSTLDTAGPMATNVSDVAVLLSSMRTRDEHDPVTLSKENKRIDYTDFLNKDALRGARIGIDLNNLTDLPEEDQKAFHALCSLLEAQGAILVHDLAIEQTKQIFQVMYYEFKRNINKYLADEGTSVTVHTLEDIIHYNMHHAKDALKYGQTLLEECQYKTSGRMNEEAYISALKERDLATKQLQAVFEKHRLDLIYFGSYTSLGPHLGFPTMTLPIGKRANNIPIGCYLLANKYREYKLLAIGYAIEQVTNKYYNPIKK